MRSDLNHSGWTTKAALPIAIGAVLVAVMATGVTYAATSSKSYTACANAKAVLAVPNSHGKCPAKFHSVQIGARGLPGKQGKQGIQGKPGPAVLSYLYKDSTQPAATPDGSSPLLTIANLPAGTYLVSYTVGFSNSSTTQPGGLVCGLAAGSQSLTNRYYDAPPGSAAVNGDPTPAGVATDTQVYTFAQATPLTVSCDNDDATADPDVQMDTTTGNLATLTAIPVASTS